MLVKNYEKWFYPYIYDWLRARELPVWGSHTLPTHGMMAFQTDMAVAAGFLRDCEGRIGMMDSFITNPLAPSHLRHKALNMLIENLMIKAKVMEMERLVFFTSEQCIIERTKDYGFEEAPVRVFTLKLI